MSLELLIYLIDRLPDCDCLFRLFAIIAGLSFIGYCIAKTASFVYKADVDNAEVSVKNKQPGWNQSDIQRNNVCYQASLNVLQFLKKLFIIALIATSVTYLIPSKKAVYLIAEVYVVKQTCVPQKVLTIINSKLDEYVKEAEEYTRNRIKQINEETKEQLNNSGGAE